MSQISATLDVLSQALNRILRDQRIAREALDFLTRHFEAVEGERGASATLPRSAPTNPLPELVVEADSSDSEAVLRAAGSDWRQASVGSSPSTPPLETEADGSEFATPLSSPPPEAAVSDDWCPRRG